VSERFDGVEYPQSVTNTGDAHLFEGELIELEQDIASNVVCLESGCMVCTLDI
jgi:hypothetical protein